MRFNTTKELIADIAAGKMVIIVDDEDRENEGDFFMAAECVSKEAINFMAHHGRGLICMPMDSAHCQKLQLPLMVPDNNQSKFSTNFTLSIEAATGVTTGISAADRARTIQVAAKNSAKASDIVQPGHIFPLMAKPGGVLTRAGHTEACSDFARLAGFNSCGVLVEILNEDGSMARRDDLFTVAKAHKLNMGTIADLIRYRIEHENTVDAIDTQEIDTAFGQFILKSFIDNVDGDVHFTLQKGDILADAPCPVRVHYQDVLSDIFLVKGMQKSWSLPQAMAYIQQTGRGVVVILNTFESSHALCSRLKASKPAKKTSSQRSIGTGSRILKAMGLTKIHVLGPPKKMHAISGYGLEVVGYINEPEEVSVDEH